jgi:AcrR family transcriptional regulator
MTSSMRVIIQAFCCPPGENGAGRTAPIARICSNKYAILEYWLREQFRQQIADAQLTTCALDRSSLQALSVVLTKWFAQLHDQARPDDRQLLPLLFTTMQQELSSLLLEWVRQNPMRALPQDMTQETIVMVMSWAIFGTSLQWTHETSSFSPEELAKQVIALLMTNLSAPTSRT